MRAHDIRGREEKTQKKHEHNLGEIYFEKILFLLFSKASTAHCRGFCDSLGEDAVIRIKVYIFIEINYILKTDL